MCVHGHFRKMIDREIAERMRGERHGGKSKKKRERYERAYAKD